MSGDAFKPTRFSWFTPALVVGVLCGGLGGAVFTWWIHREEPLRIAYDVSTTSTGADVTTNALVQGLSLRIGDKDIPAIHTHVFNLTQASGYADSIVIGLDFGKEVQVFGTSFMPTAKSHNVSCAIVQFGWQCTLSPLDGNSGYRFALATDSLTAPVVTIAGKNTKLATAQEIAKEQDDTPKTFYVVLMAGILSITASILTWQSRRNDVWLDGLITKAIAARVVKDKSDNPSDPGHY